MKKARTAIVVYILALVLLGVGCVRKEKEKKEEPPKGVEPSPPGQVAVSIAPEVQQKVENLLAPARQRELTEPEKETVVEAFLQIGKPTVAFLINELKREDLNARKVIIEILGKLRDSSAVEVLIGQLKQRREDVRKAAAKALGEIGDLKAAPALILSLRGDKRKSVRAEAAASLGLLRAKEAVIPLVQALDPTKERKRWVRRSAAEALGLIGDVQAKDALMNALGDSEKVVRVSAMFGLYKLGDTKSLGLLEQRAKDTDEEVREWAVRELGLIGAGQSVQVLAEAMEDDSEAVRAAAADALGKIPGDESLDALIAGLQDTDASVRIAVVESLARRGLPTAESAQKLFDALAELIKNDPVESVRKKARALYDAIKPTVPPSARATPESTSAGGESQPKEVRDTGSSQIPEMAPKREDSQGECQVVRALSGGLAPDGRGGFAMEFSLGGQERGPFLCVVVKKPGSLPEDSISVGSFHVTDQQGNRLDPETVVTYRTQALDDATGLPPSDGVGKHFALAPDEVMIVLKTQLEQKDISIRWAPDVQRTLR